MRPPVRPSVRPSVRPPCALGAPPVRPRAPPVRQEPRARSGDARAGEESARASRVGRIRPFYKISSVLQMMLSHLQNLDVLLIGYVDQFTGLTYFRV